MEKTGREIFRAIHEGKWLQIEYRNREKQVTRYWISILDLDPAEGTLKVRGLHLGTFEMMRLNRIYISSILSARVIEGTYEERNQELIGDICRYPEKYRDIFGNVANLKILDYLAQCSRMDTTPYYTEYSLLRKLDDVALGESLQREGEYHLSVEQFAALVEEFGRDKKTGEMKQMKQVELGLNLLSVNTSRGLYVLAYRRLLFDVRRSVLRPAREATVCYEYQLAERKQSIRSFLDAEDYRLLEHFEKNIERIKDCIAARRPHSMYVNDLPYVLAVGRDMQVDLDEEYGAVTRLYANGEKDIPYPVRAFFGELTEKPVRRKDYPFALLNRRVNLDQLLAIYNGMKYPLAYVQGPPGTGKTSTIINTVTTAFFNGRTVLVSSYNNHPVDGVYEELARLECFRGHIPFPAVRLGNREKEEEALERMKELYLEAGKIRVLEDSLDRNKKLEEGKLRELTSLLKRYEEAMDLQERSDAMDKLEQTQSRHFNLYADIHDRQRVRLEKRRRQLGEFSTEEALRLLPDDQKYLFSYFYYESARHIQRLDRPENAVLKDLIFSETENRVDRFEKYLSETENLKNFLKIFPVVLTTCIGAHKLAEPQPHFDMTIIDEASQCNVAMSLIPVLRGKSLMLVGDPQQLRPVIQLDPRTNEILRGRYHVSEEYDYRQNSIYKTYLASDSVSEETLLAHHYRCHRRIIGFNNKKYYNSKLKVDSTVQSAHPLVYVEVKSAGSEMKNCAPEEAAWAAEYAARNPDKKIGIITPFVNQKDCIQQELKARGVNNASCGTVHAFQGDEKDVILFSLALTDRTGPGTYDWLKNNKELINVATSRARQQLVMVGSSRNIERLHAAAQAGLKTDGEGEESGGPGDGDDLYELVQYVKENGQTQVTPRQTHSRALGVKPYSTRTEEAFLESLSTALDNILNGAGRCSVKREVPVKQVFQDNTPYSDLFYTGQFDFVVYQRDYDGRELPILVIELDGREHLEDEAVRRRDRKKEKICRDHAMELIRIDNSYARRYYHIRQVLSDYFARAGR